MIIIENDFAFQVILVLFQFVEIIDQDNRGGNALGSRAHGIAERDDIQRIRRLIRRMPWATSLIAHPAGHNPSHP
jgi:hypothetical protein